MNFVNNKYSWKNMSLIDFIQEGNIPAGWNDFFLKKEVIQQLQKISNELDTTRQQTIIYPPINQIFKAFYLTPLKNINAVIIGQDPYHSGTTEYNGSAVGLCFSVRNGNSINPSLRNIYKELKNSNFNPVEDGNLTKWAEQGILLLNMGLSVEKGCADSHTHLWYEFSEMVIQYIDTTLKDKIHWLLFGSTSIKIGEKLIKNGKIHKASHPSGFSANRASKIAPAFLGSGIFENLDNMDW